MASIVSIAVSKFSAKLSYFFKFCFYSRFFSLIIYEVFSPLFNIHTLMNSIWFSEYGTKHDGVRGRK